MSNEFPHWLFHFTFPLTMQSRFSTSLPFDVFTIFYFSHCDRCVAIYYWALNLCFPSGQLCWVLFVCLFEICISSLIKCLNMSLTHIIYNWIVCFLIFVFWESFLYCRYKIFVRYVLCKNFLHVCSLSFYSLDRVFTEQKSLERINISIFLLWILPVFVLLPV